MSNRNRSVIVQAPTDRDPAPKAQPKVTLNSNRTINVNLGLPAPVGGAPTPTRLDTSNSRKFSGDPNHDETGIDATPDSGDDCEDRLHPKCMAS